MHTPATERDEKGAVAYTTLTMPTGLATLTVEYKGRMGLSLPAGYHR
jgi:hypothetical protein